MRLRMNDPCWCGAGTKLKRCHLSRRALSRPHVQIGSVTDPLPVPTHIERPPYLRSGSAQPPGGPQIQDAESIERLRTAGRIAAEVLEEAAAAVAPGVTTDEIDQVAHAAYISRGSFPSTLGYKGFPKSVCTSVNEVICHGIPDDRELQAGDIVNIDVTAYVDGMHGDTSATIPVGSLDEPTAALVEVTRQATLRGVAAIAADRPLRAIGDAIEPFAHAHGFGVIREYGGHGIGAVFHAAPHVSHTPERAEPVVLEQGMSLTVEPMLTSGDVRFSQAPDGWTEIADDRLPSAQFEHTIVVTPDGCEIMTVTAEGTSVLDTAIV